MTYKAYGDLPEPEPPLRDSKTAGHHWLNVFDFDGHFHGTVVMQWQPGVKKWCHSGNCASGRDVDTRGWQYMAPCPMPDFPVTTG